MADPEETLDPENWDSVREISRRMIDDAVDYLENVRDRPVWQQMPDEVEAVFKAPLPTGPSDLETVYKSVMDTVMPYPMGNIHPRFWMWYMGSSNYTGAMGDFLAAIVGSNLGGGNHAAVNVDRQVVNWCKQMMGFGPDTSGTLVSGGSMANMIGLTVARNVMADADIRAEGVAALPEPLRYYGSDQLHGCHQKAIETLGLGSKSLRKIASGPDHRMNIEALRAAIAEDRTAGFKPACVIATAGTVNSGAIDDLNSIADICREEKIWLHVDGCIGALIAIAPENKWRVDGIERADSIALDPHKWLHAPFEVGCALIRDEKLHLGTFTTINEYLEHAERGIAAGPWLFDYGLQTSRGFRALKVWMAIKQHGIEKFGRLIDQDIAHGQYLARKVDEAENLHLLIAPEINIVCYRYDPGGLDEEALKALNTEIMMRMQETGVAAVSDTTIDGRHCLRAAINNHRTRRSDLDILVAETIRLGDLLR